MALDAALNNLIFAAKGDGGDPCLYFIAGVLRNTKETESHRLKRSGVLVVTLENQVEGRLRETRNEAGPVSQSRSARRSRGKDLSRARRALDGCACSRRRDSRQSARAGRAARVPVERPSPEQCTAWKAWDAVGTPSLRSTPSTGLARPRPARGGGALHFFVRAQSERLANSAIDYT